MATTARRKISPIEDTTLPLNSTLIAELLSLFLKCNPQVSYVEIPEFRFEELRQFARTLSGKKEITEANTLEAIGSFYILCAYYGGTAEYGSETEFIKSMSVIQTILTECFMSMKWSGNVQIVHPDDRILNMKTAGEKIKQHLLTTFVNSNELIKDIIRDIVRQIRICREKGNSKTKSKQPIDCLLTHSIYLMCAYSLSHSAAVRHNEDKLRISPGLYESLLCILHLDGIRNAHHIKFFERLRKSKKHGLSDVDRFQDCTRYARHLAFVVLKKIDITFVSQLRIFRGRLSRQRSTSPRIDYAKLKSQSIGIELLQAAPIRPTTTMATLQKQKRSAPDISDLLPDEDGFYSGKTNVEVEKDNSISDQIYPERTISADHSVLNVGTQQPESLIEAVNDFHADEAAPLTIDERQGMLQRTDSSDFLVRQESEKSGEGDDEMDVKEYKEITELMKLPIPLRSYYLLSRSLREYNNTHPEMNNNEETHLSDSQVGYSTSEKILKSMEVAYNEALKRPLPKHLNREEGMYWLCDLFIEHIYQQISAGNIFLDANQHHLHSLRLKLKNETKAVRKCREEGVQTVTVAQRIPSSPTRTEPNPTERRVLTKKITKKLDLTERLNLAKQEAILERKMDQLNEDILTRSKQETISQTVKFLKKLPDISQELLNETDSYSKTLKRASSIPSLNTRSESGSYDEFSSGRTVQRSVIWTAPPDLEDENELRKKREKRESEKRNKLHREQNFDGVPKKFGLEYVKTIKAQQEERRRQEEQFLQELKDLQELEVTRLKSRQQNELKEKKESEKKEINDSLNYKKRLEDQKREIRKKRIADKKLEEKRKAEMEEQEAEKIREIKSWSRFRQDREDRLRKERHLMERVRLKNMASAKEYEEILKSHKEEMRMKYLEEIQRAKELKRFEIEKNLHMELLQKQRKVKEEREVILGRIRKGNFMYHQGRLGYYDNVRDEQQAYIQYEDDQGYPYYFDPITLKTEYIIPSNAPVIHHTVKERREYDSLYGEGAYDRLEADKKWKDQCNKDGGYWEEGKWIQLKGYYDENYEFVSYY